MLRRDKATVTVCHGRTRCLGQVTILADILIVAAGGAGDDCRYDGQDRVSRH
ncbi:hypothetical protein [Cupriavidus sp. PET2-C1]